MIDATLLAAYEGTALRQMTKTQPHLRLSVKCERASDAALIIFTARDDSDTPPLYKRFSVAEHAEPIARHIRFQALHAANAFAYSRRTGMTPEAQPDGTIKDVPVIKSPLDTNSTGL